MFEAERQAYLKALGIVQYLPQAPIPGALESPVLDDQDIWPPQDQHTPADGAGVEAGSEAFGAADPRERTHQATPALPESGSRFAEAGAAAVSAEPMERRPVTSADPASFSSETSSELSSDGIKVNIPPELLADQPASGTDSVKSGKPRQSGAPEVEFCFALVKTPSGIALLSELGDPGVKDMSAQEHRLMNDLLQALQLPLDACRYQYFKWPLVNNPRIKQGWPEARETLTAYLDEKLAGGGASTLVVMGDQPLQALSTDGQNLQLGGRTLVTVQIPALHAMLTDWRNKARAWRMLAPLRGRHV